MLRRTHFLDFCASKNGSTVFVLEHHEGTSFWIIGHLRRLVEEPGFWNIIEFAFLDFWTSNIKVEVLVLVTSWRYLFLDIWTSKAENRVLVL